MPGTDDLPRLARLPLAVAIRTARTAVSLALDLGARLLPHRDERPASRATPGAPGRSDAAARPTGRATVATPAPAPPRRAAPEPPVPAHVDREAVLVAEFADPGAAEGAGAQVHVSEPWDGYKSLTAAEVIDRLSVAGAEELAAVRLYEGTHRNRRTVLAAADRRLRAATPPGAPPGRPARLR